MAEERQQDWIIDVLMKSDSITPAELLEKIMADPRCVAFGPIHHFIAGSVLLTCWRNAEASPERDTLLAFDLEEMVARSSFVPGAACARWGMCGAAASAGMAYAIVRGNAPLKYEGWQEGQLMVAELLAGIARSGCPRCCKRDTRVAIKGAVPYFNAIGGPQLYEWKKDPVCMSFEYNSVCMGERCPYHPANSENLGKFMEPGIGKAMKVEHAALWVEDLERARAWWEAYFGASAGDEYINAAGFHSYFLSLPGDGARVELMSDGMQTHNTQDRPHDGWGHVALSVGSKQEVDNLTARLVADGYRCVSGPRTTGDGYYESCVLDVEGNRIEITV